VLTITELRKSDATQWQSKTLDDLPDTINPDAIIWVDVEDPSETELNQLKNRFEFTNLNLGEFNEEGQRSKIEENGTQLSCFVSFPNRKNFVSQTEKDWIELIADKKWLISLHKGHSAVTCEIYKKISAHGYFALSLAPSTDILLYIFLDLITNDFFLASDMVHERLQELGLEAASRFREQPKESNRTLGLDIAKAREQVLAFRRSIGPLREVVGRVARGEFAIVGASTLPRFEDLYDRTISLIDIVDSHREELHDIGDILINVQTLTTNNIIRVLTIISAIFLPLTLIAGIYGTNFAHGFFEPGSGSIYGFYTMIMIMAGIAVALIVTFRKKGWL
jgi:magnesium transporter